MSSAHHITISGTELSQPALLENGIELSLRSFVSKFPDLSEFRDKTVVVVCDNSADNARFLLSAWIYHLTCYLLPANTDVNVVNNIAKLSDAFAVITSSKDSGYNETVRDFKDFPPFPQLSTFSFKENHTPFVIQTSGSSGKPKWVPVNNRQLFTAFESSATFVRPASGEFWLSVLPLHHIGGLSVWLRSFHRKSGVALHQPFDAENILKLLKTNPSIRYGSFVPTMLRRIIQEMEEPFSKKRTVLLGGGPSTSELIREAVNMNMNVITSYGMSETAAQITGYRYSKSNLPEDDLLWSGPVQSPNQFRFTGEDEKPNEGLLWLKGPQIFEGYRHYEEEHPFEHGWFNTGDFAQFSPQNGLRIVMRRTDRIVTGGENVDPGKVQNELRKLEGVRDAIVLGIEDEEWGQIVVAFLEMKKENDSGNQISRSQLKEFSDLAPHEIPRKFFQLSKFPTLPNGKIDREKLKELQKR